MFWTPAFAGVTLQETFYEIITIKSTKEFIVSDEMKNCRSEQKATKKDSFLKSHFLFPTPEDAPSSKPQ